MPVWTPGSYVVRDYSAHLEQFLATDDSGRVLPVRKTAKNRWRVESGDAAEIRVSYDIWAGELNVSANWVESSFALLNGAGLFLFSEQSRDLAQLVDLALPGNWPHVHTSMDNGAEPGRFRAANYDELVDSPILAGSTVAHDFKVRGQPYSLVFSAGSRYWDVEQAARDVREIIRTQQEFWGVNPFTKRYLFLNLLTGSFAGLEHDHSTVLMTRAWAMRDPHEYRR